MGRILFILAVIVPFLASAQDWKRTQNWYFGDSAGLSFATNPPTVLTDGAMYAGEGCATMSDTNGNLLFYTNGITVWSKNHEVMDNGTGLNGHISSTEGALIIPWPNNDSFYYIFTTDALGMSKGLQYSLVNIYENNGEGTVIKKNVLLQTMVSEKLASTKHLNGSDYWLVARGFKNTNFYAYLINESGLLSCPVITSIGAGSSALSEAQGEIKFSNDGTKIAEAIYSLSFNRVDLFSFNKQTGTLSDEINITNVTLPYSVEFSNNGNFLYVTTRLNYLYQYNLRAGQGNDIRNSQQEIYFSGNTVNNYHQKIQKGPDNKLYVALWDSSFISVINYPDSQGNACNFVLNAGQLSNKSTFALPNFVSSFFNRPNLDFTYHSSCDTDTLFFEGKSMSSLTSSVWNIFKNSALVYSGNQGSLKFQFKDSGDYIVQLVANGDTVTRNIYIGPSLEFGKNDTLVCNQIDLEIELPEMLRCIQWQDGADSLIYTITQTGKYFVSGYDIRGCPVSDTIQVKFGSIQKPILNRLGDSLYTDSANFHYQWFYNNALVGTNNPSLIVKQTGNYKVQITDSIGCSSISEVFNVGALSVQDFEKGRFVLYPNPSTQTEGIYIEGEEYIEEIQVFDLAGRLIHEQDNVHAFNFHLNTLIRGTYILKINKTTNYKVIIM